MFRSRHGLDRTFFEWFMEMQKQSSKINLMKLYGAYGILATDFNVVYPEPCKLNTGKKTLNFKNTDACRQHALDLHSIIYNSVVQFEFFLTSFPGKADCQTDKTLSALN